MASYAHATSIESRLIGSNSPPRAVPSAGVRPRTLSNSSASSGTTTTTRGSARRCGFPECIKTAKPGGLCISHGGGKKCSVEGCTTSVVSRGFCVAHGGGKRCQRDGCTKSAQTGGFCWIHGGGKKCGHDGCTKRAQSGGACISHGGGKRCRIEGCNKVVQYEGLCVGHGGYRKCLSMNCIKKALPNGYCQGHGGNAKCHFGECSKKAVSGGYCGVHRAFGSPQQVALSRSSSAGESPVLNRSNRLQEEATISPLMPLSAVVHQPPRDWSQAIAEAKNDRLARFIRESPVRRSVSQLDAHLDNARAPMATGPYRLPPVVELQRTCSLDRAVSPLKTTTNAPRRLGLERIAPLLSAVETACTRDANIAIKSEIANASPREPLSQQCGLPTCGRFAKVDGMCLLHYHLRYERHLHMSSSPRTRPYSSPSVRGVEFIP